MAVAVNLVPVTGQPLPLVSMGGTSIWFTCLAIGIILSVSRSLEEGDNPVPSATNKSPNAPRPRTALA
jgi:cell division protein FtsW